MLEVLNYAFPSPEQWELAIKGMRLPKKSGDKSDSGICIDCEEPNVTCWKTNCEYWVEDDGEFTDVCKFNEESSELGLYHFVLGSKDKQLLLNLCRAGDPSHRKVLRQLPVTLIIKAPLYFWKQIDQYKIGTVTNSESSMHTLTKKKFELSDFSTDFMDSVDFKKNDWLVDSEYEFVELILEHGSLNLNEYFKNYQLKILNLLRDKYLETKDMNYWYLINELLPQSYNQTRTWSANYEVLVTIIQQRRNHKLSEWTEFIEYLLENVPYLKEIVEAIDG